MLDLVINSSINHKVMPKFDVFSTDLFLVDTCPSVTSDHASLNMESSDRSTTVISGRGPGKHAVLSKDLRHHRSIRGARDICNRK